MDCNSEMQERILESKSHTDIPESTQKFQKILKS